MKPLWQLVEKQETNEIPQKPFMTQINSNTMTNIKQKKQKSDLLMMMSHSNLSIIKPVTVAKRSQVNIETIVMRSPKKDFKSEFEPNEKRIDNQLGIVFPIHRQKDFVAEHMKGFKKEPGVNIDFFRHYYRLYLKNQFQMIKLKKEKKIRIEEMKQLKEAQKKKIQQIRQQRTMNKIEPLTNQSSDQELQIEGKKRIPLKMKQFIIGQQTSNLELYQNVMKMIDRQNSVMNTQEDRRNLNHMQRIQNYANHKQSSFSPYGVAEEEHGPLFQNVLKQQKINVIDFQPKLKVQALDQNIEALMKVEDIFINQIMQSVVQYGSDNMHQKDIRDFKKIIKRRHENLSQMKKQLELEKLIEIKQNFQKVTDEIREQKQHAEQEAMAQFRIPSLPEIQQSQQDNNQLSAIQLSPVYSDFERYKDLKNSRILRDTDQNFKVNSSDTSFLIKKIVSSRQQQTTTIEESKGKIINSPRSMLRMNESGVRKTDNFSGIMSSINNLTERRYQNDDDPYFLNDKKRSVETINSIENSKFIKNQIGIEIQQQEEREGSPSKLDANWQKFEENNNFKAENDTSLVNFANTNYAQDINQGKRQKHGSNQKLRDAVSIDISLSSSVASMTVNQSTLINFNEGIGEKKEEINNLINLISQGKQDLPVQGEKVENQKPETDRFDDFQQKVKRRLEQIKKQNEQLMQRDFIKPPQPLNEPKPMRKQSKNMENISIRDEEEKKQDDDEEGIIPNQVSPQQREIIEETDSQTENQDENDLQNNTTTDGEELLINLMIEQAIQNGQLEKFESLINNSNKMPVEGGLTQIQNQTDKNEEKQKQFQEMLVQLSKQIEPQAITKAVKVIEKQKLIETKKNELKLLKEQVKQIEIKKPEERRQNPMRPEIPQLKRPDQKVIAYGQTSDQVQQSPDRSLTIFDPSASKRVENEFTKKSNQTMSSLNSKQATNQSKKDLKNIITNNEGDLQQRTSKGYLPGANSNQNSRESQRRNSQNQSADKSISSQHSGEKIEKVNAPNQNNHQIIKQAHPTTHKKHEQAQSQDERNLQNRRRKLMIELFGEDQREEIMKRQYTREEEDNARELLKKKKAKETQNIKLAAVKIGNKKEEEVDEDLMFLEGMLHQHQEHNQAMFEKIEVETKKQKKAAQKQIAISKIEKPRLNTPAVSTLTDEEKKIIDYNKRRMTIIEGDFKFKQQSNDQIQIEIKEGVYAQIKEKVKKERIEKQKVIEAEKQQVEEEKKQVQLGKKSSTIAIPQLPGASPNQSPEKTQKQAQQKQTEQLQKNQTKAIKNLIPQPDKVDKQISPREAQKTNVKKEEDQTEKQVEMNESNISGVVQSKIVDVTGKQASKQVTEDDKSKTIFQSQINDKSLANKTIQEQKSRSQSTLFQEEQKTAKVNQSLKKENTFTPKNQQKTEVKEVKNNDNTSLHTSLKINTNDIKTNEEFNETIPASPTQNDLQQKRSNPTSPKQSQFAQLAKEIKTGITISKQLNESGSNQNSNMNSNRDNKIVGRAGASEARSPIISNYSNSSRLIDQNAGNNNTEIKQGEVPGQVDENLEQEKKEKIAPMIDLQQTSEHISEDSQTPTVSGDQTTKNFNTKNKKPNIAVVPVQKKINIKVNQKKREQEELARKRAELEFENFKKFNFKEELEQMHNSKLSIIQLRNEIEGKIKQLGGNLDDEAQFNIVMFEQRQEELQGLMTHLESIIEFGLQSQNDNADQLRQYFDIKYRYVKDSESGGVPEVQGGSIMDEFSTGGNNLREEDIQKALKYVHLNQDLGSVFERLQVFRQDTQFLKKMGRLQEKDFEFKQKGLDDEESDDDIDDYDSGSGSASPRISMVHFNKDNQKKFEKMPEEHVDIDYQQWMQKLKRARQENPKEFEALKTQLNSVRYNDFPHYFEKKIEQKAATQKQNIDRTTKLMWKSQKFPDISYSSPVHLIYFDDNGRKQSHNSKSIVFPKITAN